MQAQIKIYLHLWYNPFNMNERFRYQTDDKGVGSVNGDMPENLYGLRVSKAQAGIMREIRDAVYQNPLMNLDDVLDIPGARSISAFFRRFAEVKGRELANQQEKASSSPSGK